MNEILKNVLGSYTAATAFDYIFKISNCSAYRTRFMTEKSHETFMWLPFPFDWIH
mgnify:CR=1 FL=1